MSSAYVIAIDFECPGGVPSKNAFTEVGAVLVRVSDSKIIAKFSSFSSMKGYEWEKRCVDDFWSKFPVRYAETIENTSKEGLLGPYEVVSNLLKWIKEVTADEEIRKSVYVISDNGPYDLALTRTFSDVDIHYLFGEYRSLIDVGMFYHGTSMKPMTVERLDTSSKDAILSSINAEYVKRGLPTIDKPVLPVKHSHHPVEDAACIALTWAYYQNHLQKLST